MKMKSFMKDTTLQSWTREAIEKHEKKITCEGVSNARACATGSSVVFTPTLANVPCNALFKRSTPQKQQTQQPAGTDDPAQRRVAKHLMFLHCAGLSVGVCAPHEPRRPTTGSYPTARARGTPRLAPPPALRLGFLLAASANEFLAQPRDLMEG